MPTAIEIFKFLPKKNCGKCNFPTCLAFAMQLANQKAKVSDCPYITDDARASLESSSAPPIRGITIGVGHNKVELGEETELYRHEKKFFHATRYAVIISDRSDERTWREKLENIGSLRYERVGQMLMADMVGIRNDSSDQDVFGSFVERISMSTDLPIVLISDDPAAMATAAKRIASKVPLLYAATASNAEGMAAVAKENKCPLVVRDDRGLNELADLVTRIRSSGVENMMLDIGAKDLKDIVEKSTIVRKNAIKKTVPRSRLPARGEHMRAKEPRHDGNGVNDEVRRGRSLRRSSSGAGVAPFRPETEHIHRSTGPDTGQARALSCRFTGGERPYIVDHQLLAHVFHRDGGRREEQGARMAARP